MTDIRPLGLEGLYELRPRHIRDDRGFFSETWSEAALAAAGLDLRFVQDNHTLSDSRGVLRGLHYQLPPAAQDKLVRVTRGAIFDVCVDIRRGSPTFGRWVGLEVSERLWNQVLIRRGFAHGFVALEDRTEVQYKVTAPYAPEFDRAIRFDDPAIGVEWPVAAGDLILSDKDREAPPLAAAEIGDDWS